MLPCLLSSRSACFSPPTSPKRLRNDLIQVCQFGFNHCVCLCFGGEGKNRPTLCSVFYLDSDRGSDTRCIIHADRNILQSRAQLSTFSRFAGALLSSIIWWMHHCFASKKSWCYSSTEFQTKTDIPQVEWILSGSFYGRTRIMNAL